MHDNDSGFLYIIAAQFGPIKIGITRRPEHRLTSLQVGSHSPLRLAFVARCSRLTALLERDVHRRMYTRRVRGEWFDVPIDEALAEIASVARSLDVHMTDCTPAFEKVGTAVAVIAPCTLSTETLYQDARESLEHYIKASRAPATLKAYAYCWTDFVTWCEGNGLGALPASPQDVAIYLTSLAKRGMKFSTINQRVAAIAWRHRQADYPSPTESAGVKAILSGIVRTHGAAPDKKKALTADLVAKVVRKIKPNTLFAIRDRALILLCFGAALRRSELVALKVADLEFDRKGLLVHLGKTKTDQTGKGRSVAVLDGKLKIPEAVKDWLIAAKITEGPVFRALDGERPAATAITGGQFARILKARCEDAGLDPKAFSGHSPRRGFATSAGDSGADLRLTANHMRHAKLETTMGYMEEAELFRKHAGKGFL